MNGNYLMLTLVIATVTYMIGVANRGWASPLGIWRWARGHDLYDDENPSSDDLDTDDQADAEDMPTPRAQAGPFFPPATLNGPMTGPLPITRRPQPDDDPQELRRGETRIAWTRRQLEAGLLSPGEIDDVGAKKFGVDPRTVRRWREKLAEQPTPPRE